MRPLLYDHEAGRGSATLADCEEAAPGPGSARIDELLASPQAGTTAYYGVGPERSYSRAEALAQAMQRWEVQEPAGGLESSRPPLDIAEEHLEVAGQHTASLTCTLVSGKALSALWVLLEACTLHAQEHESSQERNLDAASSDTAARDGAAQSSDGMPL